jgi:polyhydroxyalkanoate synthase
LAPNVDRDGAQFTSTMATYGRIADLQADHLMRLYQLTEHLIKSAAGVQAEPATAALARSSKAVAMYFA